MARLKKPRILIFDIETSFKIAGVWGRFNQNIGMNQLIQDMYVLCWSAKWLDDDYIYSDALHKHKRAYKKDPTNDAEILRTAWEMLDKAEYVVAHNGARFDGPIMNSRFLQHGMKPPSSYKIIDTLQVARRSFKFTSNKLDDLGKTLKVGDKMETGGFQLWKDIILNQDAKAFDKMVAYCEQDVMLLEAVYKALRPWDKKHPSTVVAEDLEKPRCNVCSSEHVVKNGSYATNTQVYQKYSCKTCGHQMRSRTADKKSKTQKNNLLTSI